MTIKDKKTLKELLGGLKLEILERKYNDAWITEEQWNENPELQAIDTLEEYL